jgi:hypothetical protein
VATFLHGAGTCRGRHRASAAPGGVHRHRAARQQGEMAGSESAQGPGVASGVGGRAGCAGTRVGERRRGSAGGGSAAAGDAQKGDDAPGGRQQHLFVDAQEEGEQGREEKLGPATWAAGTPCGV